MPAQPRLEVLASSEPDSAELVSPELVLVDPELAARARAQLVLPAPPPRPRLAPIAEDTRVDVVDRLSGSAQLAALPEQRSRTDERADVVEPSAEPSARPARPAPPPTMVALSREPQPEEPILPRPVTPAQRLEPTVEPPALRPAPAPAPPPTTAAPLVEPQLAQPTTVAPSRATIAAPVSPPTPPERRARRWPRRLRILLVTLAAAACAAFAIQVVVDVWFTTSPSFPSVARTVPPVAGEDGAAAESPVGKDPASPPASSGGNAKSPVTSPAFVWIAVPGASRYEVVFERDGKIVYRATTSLTRLELPRSWKYKGKTYRLERGRYRWTVWPLVNGKRGRAVVSSDYEL